MSVQRLTAPAGTVLFHPGMDCPGYVRLRKGRIRVTLTGPGGREVVLYRVRPGEVCLQTFACLTQGRSYSAEGVAETEIDGDILPHADFRRALTDDSGFRDEVLSAVAHRFADFEQLVEDLALTGFDARLARVLLRLAEVQGLDLTVTHEALAAETASGRAVVSRRLAGFAAQGLVAQARGRLSLTDTDGLERIAAGDR